MKSLLQFASLFLFVLASVATTDTGGTGGECGGEVLSTAGASPGEACEDREQCNEICCICDDDETVFIGRGCDLNALICLSEAEVCTAALADNPALCE